MAETENSRKINSGIILLVLIVMVMVAINLYRQVDRVYCKDDLSLATDGSIESTTSQRVPDVVMLGASWCPYCKAATRYFQKENINFCEYDVETSPTGRKLYEKMTTPGVGVPIILVGRQRIYGYDQYTIEKVLNEEGLLKK